VFKLAPAAALCSLDNLGSDAFLGPLVARAPGAPLLLRPGAGALAALVVRFGIGTELRLGWAPSGCSSTDNELVLSCRSAFPVPWFWSEAAGKCEASSASCSNSFSSGSTTFRAARSSKSKPRTKALNSLGCSTPSPLAS
jgi:hypothetical protein